MRNRLSSRIDAGLGKPEGRSVLPWVVGPQSGRFKKYDEKAPAVFEGGEKWGREERDEILAALWMMLRG